MNGTQTPTNYDTLPQFEMNKEGTIGVNKSESVIVSRCIGIIRKLIFMGSNFTERRGPAEYFHGREKIIHTFTSALEHYRTHKRGTIFLIQGAPGAGKTALIHECKKRVKKRWQIADLYPNALWSPDDLSHCLRKKKSVRVTGASAEVRVEKIIKASAGFSVDVNPITLTMIKILQDDRKPLLLILDEAQSLGSKGGIPDEMRGVITSVLYKIHNGQLGRPVMLLAAGVGTAETAFNTLNISRFEDDCRVQLGCLDDESTCAVIRDFLVHKGHVNQPPPSWVETIANQTHGWSHHIISYADPASRYLAVHQHNLTSDALEIVLQSGRGNQVDYYRIRLKEIGRKKKRQILAKIFANVPFGGAIDKEDFIFAILDKYSQKEADDLFNRALRQGIIVEHRDGDYGIPIPSFHAWLVNEYGVDNNQN